MHALRIPHQGYELAERAVREIALLRDRIERFRVALGLPQGDFVLDVQDTARA